MKNYSYFSIGIISLALIFGLSFPGFAQPETPQSQSHNPPGGHHMMEGRGDHHRSIYAVNANLSDEQVQKIEQEWQTYWDQNRDIRALVFQKNLELRAELAKLQPDPKKAVELQKELSNLEAQLDRKYIDHVLRIKAINPYFMVGHDMMRSGSMGHGGMASGMGQGSMGCDMMGGDRGKLRQN